MKESYQNDDIRVIRYDQVLDIASCDNKIIKFNKVDSSRLSASYYNAISVNNLLALSRLLLVPIR